MTIPRRLAALGASAAVAVLAVVGFASAARASAAGLQVNPAAPPVSSSESSETSNEGGAPITVDPDTIDAGGSTTISGEGCTSVRELPVHVDVSIGDGVATGTATPDETGSWSVDIEVDDPGEYTVYATCDQYLESFDYAPGSLTVNEVAPTSVISSSEEPTSSGSSSSEPATTSSESESSGACTPTLTLVDYTGAIAQGSSMGVDVTCYQPGESLQVVLHSDPIVLTTLIADSSGNASGNVTIPLDAPIGGHTVTVVGELSGISLEAAIDVVAAVETTASAPLTEAPSSTPEPVVVTSTVSLANTGVNAAAMTVWGVVLLVAGGIAVALTRKRDGKHIGD